jgi:hypothetical protein
MHTRRYEASTLRRVPQDQFLNLIPDIGDVRDHILGLGQDVFPHSKRYLVPAQHHSSAELLHDGAIGRGISGEHRAAIIEISLMGTWLRYVFKQAISLHGWAVGPVATWNRARISRRAV